MAIDDGSTARCRPQKTDLDLLYSAFLKAENKVGGGEGLMGIYGSMTQQGTCAILESMARETCLGPSSVLVDIGSGLCRPLLHAALQLGVRATYGVELDPVKCQKAIPFVQHVSNMLESEGVVMPASSLPTVICSSVEELGSLEPATHAYAAWEGFPLEAKKAVGDLFARTPSLRAITIVQRYIRAQDPAQVMEDMGFGQVRHVNQAPIPVNMAGSGRRLNAYVFVKEGGKPGSAGGGSKMTGSNVRYTATGPSLATADPYQPASMQLQQGEARAQAAAAGSDSSQSTDTVAAATEPGSGTAEHAPAHTHGLRSRSKARAEKHSSEAATEAGQHRPRVARSGTRGRGSAGST